MLVNGTGAKVCETSVTLTVTPFRVEDESMNKMRSNVTYDYTTDYMYIGPLAKCSDGINNTNNVGYYVQKPTHVRRGWTEDANGAEPIKNCTMSSLIETIASGREYRTLPLQLIRQDINGKTPDKCTDNQKFWAGDIPIGHFGLGGAATVANRELYCYPYAGSDMPKTKKRVYLSESKYQCVSLTEGKSFMVVNRGGVRNANTDADLLGSNWPSAWSTPEGLAADLDAKSVADYIAGQSVSYNVTC